jgi:DNA-binding HxlR family transcriptional regulator
VPATVRYDDQYCPIARALDVLGDRWTLLILRELVIGDQRFTDLRRHLPGIAPTVLTQRLRTLVEQGFVTTTDHSAYAITARGRSTVPVMRALARWGMPLLEEPSDERPVRAWTAVNVAVAVYFDPVAAVGVDERYLFRVDGEDIVLSSVAGGGPPHDLPDVVLESAARVWIDVRQGRLTMDEAVRTGGLRVTGDAGAVANLRRIFQLP